MISPKFLAQSKFAQAPKQDRFLGMDAILGFVENYRFRSLKDALTHFFANVSRQAVKKNRFVLSPIHQTIVNLVRRHRSQLIMRVLLAH